MSAAHAFQPPTNQHITKKLRLRGAHQHVALGEAHAGCLALQRRRVARGRADRRPRARARGRLALEQRVGQRLGGARVASWRGSFCVFKAVFIAVESATTGRSLDCTNPLAPSGSRKQLDLPPPRPRPPHLLRAQQACSRLRVRVRRGHKQEVPQRKAQRRVQPACGAARGAR